jgi:hypothetical protein
MGAFRLRASILVVAVAGTAFLAVATPACADKSEEASSPEVSEPERVPDPPPRYARSSNGGFDASTDGQSELLIKCPSQKPFVCSMDDGSFVCSERPCVPDCSRVGCVGGDVCLACDGGYRCVQPNEGC